MRKPAKRGHPWPFSDCSAINRTISKRLRGFGYLRLPHVKRSGSADSCRCREDLSDHQVSHRGVAEVAIRWGFRSAAHFTRVFHARYGAWSGRETFGGDFTSEGLPSAPGAVTCVEDAGKVRGATEAPADGDLSDAAVADLVVGQVFPAPARIGTSGPLDMRQPEVTKAPEPLGYGPVDRATVTEWPRMTTLRRFTHRIGLTGCTPPNVSN